MRTLFALLLVGLVLWLGVLAGKAILTAADAALIDLLPLRYR